MAGFTAESTDEASPVAITEAASSYGSDSGIRDRDIRIIYVTIGCLGILGNIFVILVMVLRQKLLRRIANTFILNQSIIDVLGSLFMVAFNAPKIDGHFNFEGTGGLLLCRLVENNTILFAFFTTSTYNILALTVERYMQIVFPIVHKVRMTHDKAYITMASIWILMQIYVFSLGYATTDVIGGYCIPMAVYPNEKVQQGVGILNVIIMFFIPLACIVYLYGHMLYVLHRRSRVGPAAEAAAAVAKSSQSGAAGYSNMGRAQRNLLKTVCLVTVSFVICWSTNQVYFLLINCGFNLGYTSPLYHFSVIMTFLNCCINPFIYILKYTEFQRAVRELLGIKEKTSQPTSNTSGNSNTKSK